MICSCSIIWALPFEKGTASSKENMQTDQTGARHSGGDWTELNEQLNSAKLPSGN
ncbi:hypothetical protein F442_21356 [Phytophthora nicotianae P10297]|uniref:Uncharacterized protein n=1 Tax=Phytophthora nicotianae P10297 TaxID=1317064 RepID=W2Y314_PHYNI|nr:hypothetical protein F442_21356 [Phytophthora nicotianae P10297]